MCSHFSYFLLSVKVFEELETKITYFELIYFNK